jgi:hypothetical protein
MTDKQGHPLQLTAQVRPSESMPSRLKIALTVPTGKGLGAMNPDGEIHNVVNVKGELPEHMAVSPEFRIELN